MDTYDSISVATRQHTLGGILCGGGGVGCVCVRCGWLNSMKCDKCETCIYTAGVHIKGFELSKKRIRFIM